MTGSVTNDDKRQQACAVQRIKFTNLSQLLGISENETNKDGLNEISVIRESY